MQETEIQPAINENVCTDVFIIHTVISIVPSNVAGIERGEFGKGNIPYFFIHFTPAFHADPTLSPIA